MILAVAGQGAVAGERAGVGEPGDATKREDDGGVEVDQVAVVGGSALG